MNLFRPVFSLVYRLNWNYDQTDPYKRETIFVCSLVCMLAVTVGLPMIIFGFNSKEDSALFSIMQYCLIGAFLAFFFFFRIPYLQGKLEKYMPNSIRQEREARANARHNQQSTQQVPQTDPARLKYLGVLGLSASATEEEIKKSYRKLAMKWHPDRNQGIHAENNFKTIKEAYEKLTQAN